MVRVGPRHLFQKQTTLLGSHGFSSLLKITGKSLAAPKHRHADAGEYDENSRDQQLLHGRDLAWLLPSTIK